MSGTLRLGFACHWDPNAESTWSYTPWNLRNALRERADVVDVGLRLPTPARAVMKALYTRRDRGRWVTTWKHSRVNDVVCQRLIARGVAGAHCDAVLEIQDLAIPPAPFFVLQDLTYDILLRLAGERDGSVPHFPGLRPDAIRRRRDRQLEVYDRAAGILIMSRWAASTLTEWSGVAASKVHVVYPGRTAAGPPAGGPEKHERPRRRLLLVGKDFHTKGGDVVVAALDRLRRSTHPEVTLTVAGPAAWPLPGPVPAGVTFLGRVPAAAVTELYRSHHLLVMPSRVEGFGIVFVEALAHGLPCVGRNAFAMPEIITPGRNGALVDDDDPEALAGAIAGVLEDDDLYERCARDAGAVAERFTWARSAGQVLAAIDGTLGR